MRHSLSPNERKLFDLLPENGGSVTSAFLAEKLYKDRSDPPKHPRIVVIDAINRLVKMGPINGWRVARTERMGSTAVNIWKERVL